MGVDLQEPLFGQEKNILNVLFVFKSSGHAWAGPEGNEKGSGAVMSYVFLEKLMNLSIQFGKLGGRWYLKF